MSWLYSRVLVEAFSQASSSGGVASAQWRLTPGAQGYCCKGKMKDISILSRFGMMLQPLTESHGEALLTWYRADFPAKTYPSPTPKPKASKANARASGLNSLASLGRYDPATHSLRTPQRSLLGDSTESLVTLPPRGMMQGGAVWELPMWGPDTSARDAGYWPTPVANDDNRSPQAHMRMKTNMKGGARYKCTSLQVMAKGVDQGYWPTPNVPNGGRTVHHATLTGNTFTHKGKKVQLGLEQAVKMLVTPIARDWKDTGIVESRVGRKKGRLLGEQVGGSLNPNWVEWLMGWPVDWTSLERLDDAQILSWETEPPNLPRIAKGIKARKQRLTAIGNGQVPACAAMAFRLLEHFPGTAP